MIKFEKIRFKNFLSSGGQFTEIKLDRSTTTLIIGENGAGKSTLLDALCFGLFGKAFRNINKPQLLSSVNQKDCLVEIDFAIGKKKYLVRRGIKPAIFDIFCDGILVDQTSAVRDYQSYLEEQILKINYRSFTQIVILGTASFTPFMQLPAAHRREIIEDILDIKIFSAMNVLLKERMNHLRDSIAAVENKINVQKEKTLLQKSFIKTLEDRNKKAADDLNEKIDCKKKEIEKLTESLDEVKTKINILNDTIADREDNLRDQKMKAKSSDRLRIQLDKLNKEIDFYKQNDTCPTCSQAITESLREEHLSKHVNEMQSIENQTNDIAKEIETLERREEEINKTLKEIRDHSNVVAQITTDITAGLKMIKQWEKESQPNDDHDLNAERKKLKDMAAEVVELANQRSALNEEKQYQEVCAILLKDTGIKTTVIRQYLPVINKLINKYLSIMDFFVHFELDEAFNETIKSRYRDEFSYASFSEGEKQRINLALLFTWRSIAKMKNSVSTNLLILDEVFDSSLDANGTDYVMQLLDALGDDTNIFVISHKGDQLFDKFRSVIKFEKKNNFSRIA